MSKNGITVTVVEDGWSGTLEEWKERWRKRKNHPVQNVFEAWVDAGCNPAYHEHMKKRLRKEWPVLANALDELSRSIGQ